MKGEMDIQKYQNELSTAQSKDNTRPFLEKIQSRPHWRIHLCPTVYKKRLNDLKQACELITKARACLSNEYYPTCISNLTYEHNFIASETDKPNLGVAEYWFLFHSGQFLHLLETPEAFHDSELRKEAEKVPGMTNTKAPGFIKIRPLLNRFCLFFNFVSNACQANLYDTELKIDIELKGIKDFRLIDSLHSIISFAGDFAARTDPISNRWFVQPKEISSKWMDLTLEVSCYFVSCFEDEDFKGYKPPIDKYKGHLQQFLSGKSY